MASVAVVVFLLIHLVPDDPAALIAGELATTEDVARLRAILQLDQPLWHQFGHWIGQLARGDLGSSIFTQVPVTALLMQRIEPTLSIALATTVFAMAVAIPLGTLAAHLSGGWIDRCIMLLAVLAFSTPVLLIAHALVYGFSVRLGWLPVQGYSRLSEGVTPWLRSLTLPCLCASVVFIALLTRMTRAAVSEVLKEDYMLAARAKGLGVAALLAHAVRNAAIPIATTIGIGLTQLMAGVVITETVFGIPGIGRLVFDAVRHRDYPVIQSVLLLSAGVYVLLNSAIDLSYGWLDPRIGR